MSDRAPPMLYPQGPAEQPRTSGTALAAFAFSLLGFVCMWGFGGLLGIALGVMARGEIDRAQGKQRGAGLALAGIVLGSVNILACIVGLAVGITFLARPSPAPATAAPPPIFATPAPPRPPHVGPGPKAVASAHPSAGGSPLSKDTGLIVTHVGKIDLVDVGSEVRSLGDELDRQREIATHQSKKILLWVVQPNCQPCNGVAVALPEPSMQSALESVRLVRVDPQDFKLELEQFNVPTDKIPGFALLGPDNHPLDYVNGGEWDEDLAHNIAPVLGKFVRGAYKQRRDPWRGGARDDETPL